MSSLFADENFPEPATRYLRTLGHDVLTSRDAGLANRSIPDFIVLEYSSQLGRALLTLNWDDFVQLHHERPDHAGIVVCDADANYAKLSRRIHEALTPHKSLMGQLVEVPNIP